MTPNAVQVEKNKNCLAGMACPSCGSYGAFELATEGLDPRLTNSAGVIEGPTTERDVIQYMAVWSDDGSFDTYGDTIFVDEGNAVCCHCRHEGKVKDFYTERDNSSSGVS
jgi:hypothetical protein